MNIISHLLLLPGERADGLYGLERWALNTLDLSAKLLGVWCVVVDLVQIPSYIIFLLVHKQTQSKRLNKGV